MTYEKKNIYIYILLFFLKSPQRFLYSLINSFSPLPFSNFLERELKKIKRILLKKKTINLNYYFLIKRKVKFLSLTLNE